MIVGSRIAADLLSCQLASVHLLLALSAGLPTAGASLHFADRHRQARAPKRGGKLIVPFEALEVEERYAQAPVDLCDPERLFSPAWA